MAYSLLGSLSLRQGKLEAAESSLLQAVTYVPELEKRRLSQQFESLGDAYTKAGKSLSAQRSYTQAASLDGDNPSLSAKMGKTPRK